MKTIEWLDWLVMGMYLSIVAFAALWFARRQKSTEVYFVGGRSLPGWAVGISIFGSAISTATFLAYPGNGFSGDWKNLVPGLALPIAVIFISLVVIPFYRNVIKMTAFEYLEMRFGYFARFYGAVVYVLTNIFRMGFILFLAATALHTMTGWDIRWIIIIAGIITIIYTVVGGVEAVIWTDVIQSFVLLGGGILCMFILLFSTQGGPAEMLDIANKADKFVLADLSFDLSKPTIYVMILFGIGSYASNFTIIQDSVQRYLAVRTTRQARNGIWLGAITCMITWTLFMFIGTLLYSYYQVNPEQLPAEVAAVETKVFPYFVMTCLPVGIVGLILAAMCAAAMSSLDTSINSLSMVTIYDFYSHLRPGTSESRLLIIAKVAACFWGIMGTLAALSMIRVEKALEFSYVVFSILGGGLFGIFLLGFFCRRAHASGVYIGLVCGIIVSAWGTLDKLGDLGLPLPDFYQNIKFPFHPLLLIVISNVISFVVGYGASRIFPASVERNSTGPTVWDMNKKLV